MAYENFWSKVSVGGPDDCWLWQGALIRGGYGQVRFHGKPTSAHRASYAIAHGSLPSGMDVMHACDNRRCVNPSHLSLGTAADNMRDASRKGRLPVGIRHPHARLSLEQVRQIREDARNHSEVARVFGITAQYVGQLRKRRWRTHEEENRHGI